MAAMTGGTLSNPSTASRIFAGVSIDSRTVKSGELFIALRGQRVDGHDYIDQAIARGVSGILLETRYPDIAKITGDIAVVAVNDSHLAMMEMARKYRQELSARFVGITGSNGKTTTKELTYHLLNSVDHDVYRSPGNLNNLFGMPLAIFAIPDRTRIAVMEMGISTPGEMTRLTRIVRPDVAVITNVSATHLEFLGTLEGVARAKLELVAESSPDVPVIINGDDAVLMSETRKYRSDFITYAVKNAATYQPQSVTRDGSGATIVQIDGLTFRLPLFGAHQIYNLLAAFAVARTLGYRFDKIDTAKISFDTAPMRGQTILSRGVTFIADCYNANPESVRLGLQSFGGVEAEGRKVIILGDMLELGVKSADLHREIGALFAKQQFDLALLVGQMARQIGIGAVSAGVERAKLFEFDTAKRCAEAATELLHEGDLVYVKGSRGIGLEVILQAWERAGGSR
jgi:UDP-N-acetylmuramoyl-tripeptide--D-alanyl-D-alanine ligase